MNLVDFYLGSKLEIILASLQSLVVHRTLSSSGSIEATYHHRRLE